MISLSDFANSTTQCWRPQGSCLAPPETLATCCYCLIHHLYCGQLLDKSLDASTRRKCHAIYKHTGLYSAFPATVLWFIGNVASLTNYYSVSVLEFSKKSLRFSGYSYINTRYRQVLTQNLNTPSLHLQTVNLIASPPPYKQLSRHNILDPW